MKIAVKILLIILSIIFIVIFYIYYVIIPGNIDYYLNKNIYNKIVNTLLSTESSNIYGIQYNIIYFKDRSSCGLKKTEENNLCSEKYFNLLKIIKSANISDIDINAKKNTVKIQINGGNSIIDNSYKYYLYKKDGFSEEEKNGKNVIKVINNNWIVAIGYISS